MLAGLFSCQQTNSTGSNTIDGSNTEVSARERLQDYLHYSRYPDNSRPATREAPAPEDIPLIEGDASNHAQIESIESLAEKKQSISLNFKVHVKTTGTYRFHSLLLCTTRRKNADSDETMHYPPVATGSTTVELKKSDSLQTVEIVFYGLIIRESGCTQFGIQSIAGEKIPGGNDADIVASGGSIATGGLKPLVLDEPVFSEKYRSEDFTDKKFDSPGKQQKIDELKRQIELEENQP